MKLYCGTYKKYNEGSLFGKWLDLDDYSDKEEFLEACAEIHKDEKDPEFMFQDMETDYDWEEKLYCESSAPEEYWEIKEAIKDSGIDEDIFSAFLSSQCEGASVEMVKKCENAYTGHHYETSYNAGEEYAEEEFYETHSKQEVDSMEWILRYVDWSAVWRDMTFDGYFEEDGYIFNNNW